ncbi:MFS-type transporter, putative yfcJ (plasmid) [Bradyrhizobium guangxiense]
MPERLLPATAADRSVSAALWPLMAVVLVAFLIMGLAIPVLPLHVHRDLGLPIYMVGFVTGAQFAVSLISRFWTGRFADSRGPKRAVIGGLLAAAAAGVLYLVSLSFTSAPHLSVAILLIGRAVLGAAESFIMTGTVIWGLSRAGEDKSGMVIAWLGISMFAGFAAGAPLGTSLYDKAGFAAVAVVTGIVPLLTLLLVVPLPRTVPVLRSEPKFFTVFRQIWVPGLGAALSAVGYGAVTTFSSLLFAERNWSPVWLAFTAYAVGLILARVAFGHLPDGIGGAKAALYSIVVEATGLTLSCFASSAALATLGAALTGAGYALVFPGFGAEVVGRASPDARGVAMGVYTAGPDFALGVSGPALGLIAGRLGLSAVFLVSAATVLLSVTVALRLLHRPGPRRGSTPIGD